jgi:DNA (cytosine-5)-methyltransferase 1
MSRRKIALGFFDPKCCVPPKFGKSWTKIKHGDVIGLRPDQNSMWSTSDQEWLAYVQGVDDKGNGDVELSVLYLYRPGDTTISDVDYPIKNELFLSDNCNCGIPAYPEAVTGRYSIDWRPGSQVTDKDYIVRQTYLTNSTEFVTMQQEHLSAVALRVISLGQRNIAVANAYTYAQSQHKIHQC